MIRATTFHMAAILLAGAIATASAQDQCKPIGWATRSGRTGGAYNVTGGGNATPVVVKTFADLQKAASGTDPKVIHIDGTLGNGWKDKSGDRLVIGSNKTIVGMRAGTQLKACIYISNSSNVIVRNIKIVGPGSNTDQSWDNINIDGSSRNIWIDHSEFWDGQDGNADVVKGADNVSFTWCIFGYTAGGPHNLSNLIASSDDEPVSVGKLNITIMSSWFRGINQRGPRCRYGNVHVVNTLYTTDGLASQYAVSAGKDCQVLTENNHFIGTSSPIYTGHKAGTSAHEVRGNLFEGTSGNQTGYGTAFTPPYEYKSFMLPAKDVKAAVQKHAGATLASPTACGGSTSISPLVAMEGDRMHQEHQTLFVSGFQDTPAELSIVSLDGQLHHRTALGTSLEPRGVDLSSLGLRTGIYLAVVRADGHAPITSRIHLVR